MDVLVHLDSLDGRSEEEVLLLWRPCHPHGSLRPRLLEQPRYRNVQWFRGGLVFEAHGLLYHSD